MLVLGAPPASGGEVEGESSGASRGGEGQRGAHFGSAGHAQLAGDRHHVDAVVRDVIDIDGSCLSKLGGDASFPDRIHAIASSTASSPDSASCSTPTE